MSIKKKRMSAKMTQQELANALGVERSTVSMWETGNSFPRAELLPKIAKILKCKIEDLLKRKLAKEGAKQ